MLNKTCRFVISRSLGGALVLSGLAGGAFAGELTFQTNPGNLLLSRTVYDNKAANVTVGQSLPPNCVAPNCVTAVANGSFPVIFNNAPVDGSFGITSAIYLDEISPWWGETAAHLHRPQQRAARGERQFGPDGHQLLLEIRTLAASFDGWQARDLHGL